LKNKKIKKQLQQLDDQLIALKIDKKSVCIVGSFVLSLYNIRENLDLDIVIHPKSKKKINKKKKAFNISKEIEVVGDNWASTIGINDESLVNDSKFYNLINEFKIVKPEILFLVMLFRGREKNLKDVENLQSHALESKQWDWDLIRKVIPKSRTHDFKIKKPIKKKVENIIKLPNTINSSLQNQVILKISTSALLNAQFTNGEFSRYDLLLYYDIIQQIDSQNKKKSSNYNKIIKNMKREDMNDLSIIISSFKKDGFRSRYPIIVSTDGFILDGAKRMACAIYFDIFEIPIIVQSKKKKKNFKIKWIESVFGKKVSTKLESTKDQLFMKRGLWAWVMLWSPAEPWFNEISQDLEKFTTIKMKKVIHLKKSLPDFMRKMYSMDDIQKWKIELKINAMQDFKPTVLVLGVEFKADKYRIKNDAPGYQSETAVYLKKLIRKKYGMKVPNYFYDIIIHIGDNHEHNRKTYDLLNEDNYFTD
jgi:hypothetical protein